MPISKSLWLIPFDLNPNNVTMQCETPNKVNIIAINLVCYKSSAWYSIYTSILANTLCVIPEEKIALFYVRECVECVK